MSKFEELFGNKKQLDDSSLFTEIDGTFTCMTCDEYVEVGKWYQMDKVLSWECSLGHKNMIENFG